MKVAISGATGFVGKRLVERLHLQGHHILVLTRNVMAAQKSFPSSQFPNVETVAYTPSESGDWQQSIAGCDGVVNLAGEPIAEGRWTAARKQEILHSRKLGTQKIVEAIALANPKPQVLVNASAIGYYVQAKTRLLTKRARRVTIFWLKFALIGKRRRKKLPAPESG